MSRRTPTQRDLVLRLLREADGRGITSSEMRAAGVSPPCAVHVHELRERGYVIASERLRPGDWRDTLVSEPHRGGGTA